MKIFVLSITFFCFNCCFYGQFISKNFDSIGNYSIDEIIIGNTFSFFNEVPDTSVSTYQALDLNGDDHFGIHGYTLNYKKSGVYMSFLKQNGEFKLWDISFNSNFKGEIFNKIIMGQSFNSEIIEYCEKFKQDFIAMLGRVFRRESIYKCSKISITTKRRIKPTITFVSVRFGD